MDMERPGKERQRNGKARTRREMLRNGNGLARRFKEQDMDESGTALRSEDSEMTGLNSNGKERRRAAAEVQSKE
jgi:hypothetical protein